MSKALINPATVPGWGVDADPQNDPTYPIRHIGDQKTRGLTWGRPALQRPDVEILRSIEHNRLPAVVGTSTPPSGLSGMLRRYAFRRSESDWWHWLLLMGADRVNVVEGMVDDLRGGAVPNIPAEMGIGAEWQYNRARFLTKVGAVAAASLAAILIVRARRTDASDATPAPERRWITGEARETALGEKLHTSERGGA